MVSTDKITSNKLNKHTLNLVLLDHIRDVIYRFYGEEDVSIAKNAIYEHYEEVIGPRPARQNRGVKTLKEKEVEDIMDAMKKIDESGNDRRVKFVALNLTNLPSIRDQSAADNNNVHNRVAILEIQMAELCASKVSEVTVKPCRSEPVAIANKPLPMRRDLPPARPHVPAWKVADNTGRIVQRPGEPLPYIQHAAIEPQHVNLQSQPSENTEWRTQQKKRRPAQYGKRKDDGLAFKAVPRRHECVVFNAPQGCTTDTVKSYIVDNGVDVLDIKRLSQEEWDTQTFYISVRYDDLSKVSDADFWPEHIGYRRYYKKRRTINDNGGTTQ